MSKLTDYAIDHAVHDVIDDVWSNTLVECAKIIGRSIDSGETIRAILSLLANRIQLNKGRVLLRDDTRDALRIRYSHGLTPAELDRGSYAMGEGITGRVMSTGQAAIVPDISSDPAYLGRVASGAEINATAVAYIAVPIWQHDEAIGVLAAHPGRTNANEIKSSLHVLQVCGAMIGQVLQIESLVRLRTANLEAEYTELKEAMQSDGQVYGILGKSDQLRHAISTALRASKSSATVLMVGESGSGKERFARMIHLSSDRRGHPFVCVNCAAIPEDLLESELFGHEKGSFTGAIASRAGKFEVASGGTLFLDEIGDMSLDLQSKLLRALQEKRITRVGASNEIEADVRIVSATNIDLDDAVKRGAFRLDLYFRLNVLRIQLPPLRDRDGDIKLLALYFLNRENQRYRRNVTFTARALDKLESYPWPGNIRQLENVIERAVIMLDSDRVLAEHIDSILEQEPDIGLVKQPLNVVPATPRQFSAPLAASESAGGSRPYQRVSDDEKEAIESALRQTRGNKTEAAKTLGMSTRQLQYRLGKLRITG